MKLKTFSILLIFLLSSSFAHEIKDLYASWQPNEKSLRQELKKRMTEEQLKMLDIAVKMMSQTKITINEKSITTTINKQSKKQNVIFEKIDENTIHLHQTSDQEKTQPLVIIFVKKDQIIFDYKKDNNAPKVIFDRVK